MAHSASVTSTGTAVAGSAIVLGVQFRAGASAGSITLRDGGAGGATKLVISTPAGAGFADFLPVAGGGIPFGTDVHATLDQADGCSVIYQ